MSQRPDRHRAGRESATWSAWRVKVAQGPPQVDRQRGGGVRFGRANDAEGSSS